MKNKVIIKCIVILLMILIVLLIKNIIDICVLKINLLEIGKTNILIKENHSISNMYISEFINKIKEGMYNEAYEMTDKTNSEYKFGNYDNFVSAMKTNCQYNGEFNDNYIINIISITQKEKYNNVDFEILFLNDIEYKKIAGVLREYKDNTFKIFITDYTEE